MLEEPIGNKTIPPTIDFSTQTVAVAAMGRQSNTGYWLQITRVLADESRLFVVVEEFLPAPSGCFYGGLETLPVTAVVIEATADSVEFIERRSIRDCD